MWNFDFYKPLTDSFSRGEWLSVIHIAHSWGFCGFPLIHTFIKFIHTCSNKHKHHSLIFGVMSLSKLQRNLKAFVAINQVLAKFWLNIWQLFLWELDRSLLSWLLSWYSLMVFNARSTNFSVLNKTLIMMLPTRHYNKTFLQKVTALGN